MRSQITVSTLVVLGGCILGNTVLLATPMGTAFTYQGRFNVGGGPANGAYDFEFKLFDAATAGNQLGSTVLKNDLTATDGYFTTTLDFGAGRFTGDARWLQIAVRPGDETGAYATLTPRHELTPIPYAINSDNEGTANYIPKFTTGGIVDSVLYEASGKVGIGTTTPQAKLHLDGSFIIDTAGPSETIGTPGTQPFYVTRSGGIGEALSISVNDHGALIQSVQDENSSNYSSLLLRLGNLSGQMPNFQISDYRTGTDAIRFHLDVDTGNVGIGTTTPGYLLTTKDTGTVAAVNLSDVLYVDAANERVGIGFDNPIVTLDVRDSSDSAQINVQSPGNPAIELRSTNGGLPYMDFSNDASIDYDMRFFLVGDDTLLVDGGNLGIGTSAPVQKLDVNGTVRCVSVVQTSDEQLKTNIQPLAGVLTKLDQVRAVSFQWNEKAQSLGAKFGERQIGVLAQELERAFPEMVITPEPVSVSDLAKGYREDMLTPEVKQRLQRDADATNYKAVDYSQLTVVLLKAVKELRAENLSLQQRIEALEGKAQ